MKKIPTYIIWDFWSDKDYCYAIYEKDTDGKLYFTGEVKKQEPKLLEKKLKKTKFMGFLKNLFKRKDK